MTDPRSCGATRARGPRQVLTPRHRPEGTRSLASQRNMPAAQTGDIVSEGVALPPGLALPSAASSDLWRQLPMDPRRSAFCRRWGSGGASQALARLAADRWILSRPAVSAPFTHCCAHVCVRDRQQEPRFAFGIARKGLRGERYVDKVFRATPTWRASRRRQAVTLRAQSERSDAHRPASAWCATCGRDCGPGPVLSRGSTFCSLECASAATHPESSSAETSKPRRLQGVRPDCE